MSGSYAVYCHENKVNGKRYVGKTKNIKSRWGVNGSGYTKCLDRDGHNSYFANAILKYGWDSFNHIILEDGLTADEACEREAYYIGLYKTNVRRFGDAFGYNMTDGGDGAPGRVVSDESRHKMSVSHRGKHQTDAARKKISQAGKGRPPLPPAKRAEVGQKISAKLRGRKLTDTHKRNIAAASKKRGVPQVTRDASKDACMKYVRCIETCEVFRSLSDASDAYGISLSYLSACCNGKRKHAKGLHWEFAKEPEIQTFNSGTSPVLSTAERHAIIAELETVVNDAACSWQGDKLGKHVLCVELNTVYNSIAAAASAIGTDKRNISQCASGRSRTCCGYHWKFV